MTNVFLDMDPGHDDAFALILALNSPSELVNVLGITTSAGNQTLARTTINALRLLVLLDRTDIVVGAGQSVPLIEQGVVCPEIHGETGLDTLDDNDSQFRALVTEHDQLYIDAMQRNGIVHMRDCIVASQTKVDLVCTGCLTNAALLLKCFPEVENNLRQIVFLGGAVAGERGNISPAAEYNVLLDPHAASIVFHSGIKIVQVPIDATHECLITEEYQSTIDHPLFKSWLSFFRSTYRSVFGMSDPPLHDPLAVYYVIAPHHFDVRFVNVEIETTSQLSKGSTVADWHSVSGRQPNVHVALRCTHISEFFETLKTSVNKC